MEREERKDRGRREGEKGSDIHLLKWFTQSTKIHSSILSLSFYLFPHFLSFVTLHVLSRHLFISHLCAKIADSSAISRSMSVESIPLKKIREEIQPPTVCAFILTLFSFWSHLEHLNNSFPFLSLKNTTDRERGRKESFSVIFPPLSVFASGQFPVTS